MKRTLALVVAHLAASIPAQALEFDWSGQFRAENHLITGYASDAGGTGGYGVREGGASSASFQTLFMRVKPKVVVNDNIYLRSEWWLGDPLFGFFGNAAPSSFDQRQFYSSQSRGSVISAQRFWGEFQTDFGLVQAGRMPLHYGLGIVWNSGDGLFDRYQSTGDSIRYTAKLGSLTISPSFIKYSMGNSVAGSCAVDPATGACSITTGRGNVFDYSALVKYEVLDEDLEVSVNLIRHIVDASQDGGSGYWAATGIGGSATTTYDLFARKKIGKFTLAAEVPIVSGDVGGIARSTVGMAAEIAFRPTSSIDLLLKAGRAPGQPNFTGTAPGEFNAFFFNPTYRLGLIMFNYQLNGFAGLHSRNNPAASPTQLASPFDNPIANANYLYLSGGYTLDKWQFRPGFIIAVADQAAEAGQGFYNTWTRQFVPNAAGNQGKSLGTEFDLSIVYQMDDAFTFGLDSGLFLPGSFYRFSNAAAENNTSAIFASLFRVGVAF